MPMQTYDLDEAYALARSLMRSYVTGADVSEGSDYDLEARILAALFVGNQGQAQFLVDQIFPEDADEEHLERHATARGIGPRPATKASGMVVITATAGTDTQLSGSTLTHDDGTTFELTSNTLVAAPTWSGKSVVVGSGMQRVIVSPNTSGMSVGDLVEIDGHVRAIQGIQNVIGAIDLWEPLPVAPEGGMAIYPIRGAVAFIRASEAGPEGNKPQGDVLTLDAPTGSIEATVRVIGLTSGADEETVEEVRANVLRHDQQRPAQGNPAQYREWARELVSSDYRIADACVYPGYRGLGTYDIIPIGPSGARQVTQAQIDAVQEAIEGVAPFMDDILVKAGTMGLYTEVFLDVTYETTWEPDWQGEFAITGGTTNTLLFGSSPVGTIEPGDRLMVQQKVGAVWVWYECKARRVEAWGVELDQYLPHLPSVNPDGRSDVYPGSPNAADIYRALDTVFDALGPGVGNPFTYAYARHPLPSIEWDPVLRLSSILSAVRAVRGVRDVAIITINGSTANNIMPAPQEFVRRGQFRVSFSEP